ncbi:MAG TPA: hypothetical protein V6D17_03920 [Candidatus Obscuribacterales bacterium]
MINRFAAIVFSFLLICPPSIAGDASPQIVRELMRAKVFPAGTSIQVRVNGRHGFVKIDPYVRKSDDIMRIDAVLSAKEVVDAAPAVASVITRFPDRSGGFTDVVVSARQIISFGAGTMGRAELLSSLTTVPVLYSDPKSQVFDRYLKEGEKALAASDNAKAEQLFLLALSESQGFADGAKDPRLANSLLVLAKNYENREDYDSAERVLKNLISLRDTAACGNDSESTRAVLALADLHILDKRPQEAAADLERVLAARRAASSTDTAEYAALLEKLASCYKDTAKEQELLRQAVSVREGIAGSEDASMVEALERLGDSYAQGKPADAHHFYRRAIDILNKAAVTKNQDKRISYDLYNAHMRRLQKKLAAVAPVDHHQRTQHHW